MLQSHSIWSYNGVKGGSWFHRKEPIKATARDLVTGSRPNVLGRETNRSWKRALEGSKWGDCM